MRIFVLAVLCVGLHLPASGQADLRDQGDRYFHEATSNLFQHRLDTAEALFHKSRAAYEKLGDSRKVSSCLMGLGLVTFSKGYYEKALKIFESARDGHMRCCAQDIEGLMAIEDNINLCRSAKANAWRDDTRKINP